METEALDQEVLAFFKALASPERLKIVGLLAIESLTAPQIAARLQVQPAAVIRHLEQLAEIKLVKSDMSQADDPGREAVGAYRLDTDGLQQLSHRVLAGSRPRATPADFEGEAYDRKVLSDFMTADGKLKAIPMQEKKRQVILRRLVQEFTPGERYTEKQVNEILKRFHPDSASLRRGMIDNGTMARQDGVYWRVE